jgi:NMD protein affecting ribosome stability and mRNA decay
MKFCVECGKSENNLIDGMCPSCFVQKTKILSFPKEISIQVCKDCGARKRKNSWIRNEQNMIRSSIIENVVLKKGKLVDLTFEKVKGDRYKSCYNVNFLLEHRGIEFEKKEQVDIRIKYSLCDECSRKRSGYYEAIVQIRGNIPERWEEEIREARVGEVKTGFNLYFLSLSDAREAAKKLIKKYGGEHKESKKLHTVKDGKRIYKFTILLRFQVK